MENWLKFNDGPESLWLFAFLLWLAASPSPAQTSSYLRAYRRMANRFERGIWQRPHHQTACRLDSECHSAAYGDVARLDGILLSQPGQALWGRLFDPVPLPSMAADKKENQANLDKSWTPEVKWFFFLAGVPPAALSPLPIFNSQSEGQNPDFCMRYAGARSNVNMAPPTKPRL